MDNFLREFDMKILLGMIAKGKDAEDVRRYARARYKDEEITHGDLEEIDRLLDERDTPVEEVSEEPLSEEDEGSFKSSAENTENTAENTAESAENTNEEVAE